MDGAGIVRILAVGSPKGGVGKTTTAVTLAALAARVLGLQVLLVDCDSNRSALDWCAQAGDSIPVDTADGRNLSALRQLRKASGYDLAVVDLPGAREGAFQAVLTGDTRQPVADLLIVPTEPEVMSVRPVIRVIRSEVIPLGIPHILTLCRVTPQAYKRATDWQTYLGEHYDLTVARTLVRTYTVYREALETSQTVLDINSRYARPAKEDYRNLASEVLYPLGFDITTLGKEVDAWHTKISEQSSETLTSRLRNRLSRKLPNQPTT